MIVFTASNLVLSNAKLDLNNLGGFKCFGTTKMNVPIRLSPTGDVECFSLNGRDCVSQFRSDHECRSFIAQRLTQVKSVTCGKMLKELTGKTGYKVKGHWCQKGRKYFYKKWHCTYDTGLDYAVRLDRKTFKPQCLSLNGKTCVRGHLANKACNKANHCKIFSKKIKAVTCGSKSLLDPSFNWCKKAFAHFRYTGDFSCKSSTKLATPVRIDQDGFIQCLSHDGKNCKWGLNSDLQCHQTVMQATDGGRRTPVVLNCGDQLKKLTGNTGLTDKNHWCRVAYRALYKRQKPDAYLDGKILRRQVAHNFKVSKPVWFRKLAKFIRSPAAKTPQGLRRIRRALRKRGFKGLAKFWRKIVAAIKSGKLRNKKAFRKLIRRFRRHIRGLRFHRIRRMPRWWLRVIRLIRSKRGRTPQGIKHIFAILKKHKARISPARWNKIALKIKAGNLHKSKVYHRIIRSIRRLVPALKSKKSRRAPKWWRRIVRFIRSRKARTLAGINRIKAILVKKGMKISPKRWNGIVAKIRSGQIRSPKVFRRVIRFIRRYTPRLRVHGRRHRRFRFGWFRRLVRFIRSAFAKTPKGINRIRRVLRKRGFRFTPKRFAFIVKRIKSGKIRSPKVFKRIIRFIRKHTPKLRVHRRRHRSPKWFKRLVKFIRSAFAKTPKGINRIRSILRKRGFRFTPKRFAFIVKRIKSGKIRSPKVFKRIIRFIRRHTPKLRIRIHRRKHRAPKWFKKFIRFIRTPFAKTPKGINRIRAVLRKRGFRFTPKRFAFIVKRIRSGKVRSPKIFRRIVKFIRRHTPRLRIRIHRRKHRRFRFGWFRKLAKFIRSAFAKTPKGINRIRTVLRKRGFRFTPKRFAFIVKRIKSGKIRSPKVFKRIIKFIRTHTPKLRIRVNRRRHRSPKWFKRLVKFIRSAFAKTPKGINRIRAVLRKRGFRFTPKRFAFIVKRIKSGKIRSPKVFKRIIRFIRRHTPKLRVHRRRHRGLRFRFGWFRRLARFIRSVFAKTPKGINRIRSILRKRGFRFTPKRWNFIVKRIKSGKIRSPKIFKRIVRFIRRHTPKLRVQRRRFRGPRWFRKLIKFIRSAFGKTPKGILRIRHILKKRGFRFTPKRWQRIVNAVKSGKFRASKHFKRIIKKLSKKNRKGSRNVYLSIKGKYCRKKFMRKIRKLLKRKDAKKKSGLRRIKKYLSKYFKLDKQQWRKIKAAILANKLRTRHGKRLVIGEINKNIPQAQFKESFDGFASVGNRISSA